MTPAEREASLQKGNEFRDRLSELGNSEAFLTEHNTEPDGTGTDFTSGGKGVKQGTQDYFNLAREMYPEADSLTDLLEDVFKAPGGNEDFLEGKQNFRDTLVAQSNNAQRSVRAVNQAVFTGRRKRRGSNVSLPKIALAGLNQNV